MLILVYRQHRTLLVEAVVGCLAAGKTEEEEFMWEMHSRLSEHDAANISNYSRKDHWTPDVSEKLVSLQEQDFELNT